MVGMEGWVGKGRVGMEGWVGKGRGVWEWRS